MLKKQLNVCICVHQRNISHQNNTQITYRLDDEGVHAAHAQGAVTVARESHGSEGNDGQPPALRVIPLKLSVLCTVQ